MEPLWPDPSDKAIEELAIQAIRKSARLGGLLHPTTREAVAGLLVNMNSYYSNLIEGHHTNPVDIDRVLRSDYSDDPAKRALQLESRAHIEVQGLLEERLRAETDVRICSAEFLCWIHSEFYRRMPEEFCRVKDPRGGWLRVEPGRLREREVAVGSHDPPAAASLPGFLERFAEAYEPSRLGEVEKPIAAAASHHRLAWIHPFLDGNGRVARLFTHAYLIRSGVDGNRLWAMARGLARHREDYLAALREADQPRRGGLDGRGSLTNRGLVQFIRFFLETALDQIDFMTEILDLEALERRIHGYVERLSGARELKPQAFHILRQALLRGEIARGEAARSTGMPERTARTVLRQLLDQGLLVSRTPKGPLRLGFPFEAVGYYFPRLYPEGTA